MKTVFKLFIVILIKNKLSRNYQKIFISENSRKEKSQNSFIFPLQKCSLFQKFANLDINAGRLYNGRKRKPQSFKNFLYFSKNMQCCFDLLSLESPI